MSSEKNVRGCHRASSPNSRVIEKRPLALIARIATAALLGGAFTVSCAPPLDRGDVDGGEDRADQDLGGVTSEPETGVCVNGPYRCMAHIRTDGAGQIKRFASVSGIGPAEIQSAYKLDVSKGSGAVIAIVDAYGYKNAEADLAKYRSQYGLKPCGTSDGCLTIVNQNGQKSPLPADPPSSDDWTVEAALDLDAASAACPNCKLLYIQADGPNDGLFIAQNTAAKLGATVISNSWGGPEDGNEASYDQQYFNHPGVAIFVASGDAGWTGTSPDYPSTSQYVIAVGGTKLVKSSSNTRGWTEGAWTSGGSSCSKSIAKPSYQTNTACTKRATVDVAAVGDPSTGLAVYNSKNGGWLVIGGTSAACPVVASIYALTGHGADKAGDAYANSTKYFDITTGKNGSCGNILCNAGAGWDGPTGVGSPNGALLAGGGGCTPSCTGKMCGPDGCGGTCGPGCGANQTCTANGQCQDNGCTPSCNGKTCGDDGCGGSCGTCSGGATCNNGTCTGGGGTCAHPICSTGDVLDGSCDACAASICAVDSYCCDTAWDSICVGEVSSVCHQTCGGGGSCTHDECATGPKLKTGCDACVTKICAKDSYCCNNKWDKQCVSEVGSICGETCN